MRPVLTEWTLGTAARVAQAELEARQGPAASMVTEETGGPEDYLEMVAMVEWVRL